MPQELPESELDFPACFIRLNALRTPARAALRHMAQQATALRDFTQIAQYSAQPQARLSRASGAPVSLMTT
jgi:hypothetical protein